MMKPTSVSISEEQLIYIKKHKEINFSGLVQNVIQELIDKEKRELK